MDENERPETEQPEEAAAPQPTESPAQAAEPAEAPEAPGDAESAVSPPSSEPEAQPQEDAQAGQERWIARDAALFAAAYPDVDLAKLDGDTAFRRFCGSRYGKEPLASLYADWQELTETMKQAAAVRSESKAGRSTGAGVGSGADTLTAAQQRALDEWNRDYPHMRMTAKEFLSR